MSNYKTSNPKLEKLFFAIEDNDVQVHLKSRKDILFNDIKSFSFSSKTVKDFLF